MKKNKINMRFLTAFVCLLFIAGLLSQCKKHNNDTKTFTLSGYVVDESGIAVKGAVVSVNGQSITDNNDGTFSFSGLPNQSTYNVEVTATGYFDGYRNVDNVDGSSLAAVVTLITKTNLGTLPSNGGSVGATGLRVVAPAGSFKNADGSAYSGAVTVASRYIQGNNAGISASMPGGDFMAKDASGNDGAMLTYGFVATEFKDASGNKLTPGANVKVAVTIPAGVNSPVSNGAQAWSYDKNTGKWSSGTTITQTGSEYFFPATTLYQNMDKFALGFGTIEGQVQCMGGTPSAYTTVTVQSTNYNNKYITKTNENGKYRVKVAAKDGNVVFLYTVTATGGGTVNVGGVTVGATAMAPVITLSTCGSGSGGGGSGSGSGSFTANGGTYSGICQSITDIGTGGALGNIDVIIATTSGASFNIYNMPKASSGTYSFTDGYNSVGGSNLYGLCNLASGTQYATKNGSVTKTGASSFTFTCTVYDIISNQSFGITGSGNY